MSIKFQWRRRAVPSLEWRNKYSDSNYCILNIHKDGSTVKEFEFAYIQTEKAEPNLDLTCDDKDLEKIKSFLEHTNSYPRPENQEIKVAEIFT